MVAVHLRKGESKNTMSDSILQELGIKLISKDDLENGAVKAIYEIEPLERSFAITLGNTLRRVCLSHLPGTAVTSMKIKGINHEFASIPNILEDTIEVGLNCKSLVFKTELEEPFTLTASRSSIGEIRGSDFELPAGVELVNPDTLIATVTADNADFNIELTASRGKGYVLSSEQETENMPVDTIFIDSAYMPVKKFSYRADPIRVGEAKEASSNKYEKLTIEMLLNGSIQPEKALSLASKMLLQRLSPFMDLTGETLPAKQAPVQVEEEEVEQQDDLAETGVETLNLSVRSYNCLKRANKNNLRDLVQMTTDELMGIKNFGRKSAEEVIRILQERGYHLVDAQPV